MNTTLFAKGPSLTSRFLLLAVVSIVLMVFDQRTNTLEKVHKYLGTILHPLQQIVDYPSYKVKEISDELTDELTLVQQNRRLETQNRILSAQLQEFIALKKENDKLRSLLDSAPRAENNVMSARMLAVSLNPFKQRILIDKGTTDGVTEGIAIVDDKGLMGQVTRTFPFHSEGMLASDPNHAIPVESVRTGVRGIVVGTGNPLEFKMINSPLTADLEPGDTLITSGIGGRFPADYPVAEVKSVKPELGRPFTKVTAKPLASLDQNKNILLIRSVPWSPKNTPASEE